MKRTIFCHFLKKKSEGLQEKTYPGKLGIYIYKHISKKAWFLWLSRQTIIINEKNIDTRNDEHKKTLEIQMKEFLKIKIK
ncbi:oxidative damage protection protein [Buchnera aphidicola (Taiwanaphis decaspermi)]|uniref:oxidative damage protection protein n=1 Tax=Buchnera aphidicola TaxID=9 RepID=UPI0031B80B5C